MLQSFYNKDAVIIVCQMIDAIVADAMRLSRIDGEIGDGDHGVNMSKGFSMAGQRLEDKMTLNEAFGTVGITLMDDIGGSMGPIYGTLFIRMARALKEHEKIDKTLLLQAMESALAGVMDLTGARVGDKTLVDSLAAAVDAYGKAVEGGAEFAACMQAMADGAQEGFERTTDLVAKLGRAARLGERSRGVPDAGAASCCLLLQTLAAAVVDLLTT